MPSFRLGPAPTPPIKPPRARPPDPPPTLFEQLLPCSWRDVDFPISSMKVTLTQDLVEHKYWGVDVASVEATGRAPMQIEATIPFVNGIVPGKGEKWGVLYPTVFRAFLRAFADRTTGILVHPELGQTTCKPHSIEFSHDAHKRDGVEVIARWTETFDDDHLLASDPSPIQVADLAALDLDASKDDIVKLAPEAAFPEETFDSFVNKLSGFVDSVSTTATLLAHKPAQILNRVQTLEDSVLRAKNALAWPVLDACERMKEAMVNMQRHQVLGAGPSAPAPTVRKISRHLVKSRTTLARLGADLSNSTDDLIALNPNLLAHPEVPEGSVVRFYG